MNLFLALLAAISLLIHDYAENDRVEDKKRTLAELRPDDNIPNPAAQTYDFIVVGCGSAGSIVASRLSEKYRVLVLESGGNPPPATESQFYAASLPTHPDINRLVWSRPQLNIALELGGIAVAHTGRMFGGSGSHNDNAYNRGSPHDYDNFAAITGDVSWRYENVLKHFKDFENFNGTLIDESERTVFYANRGPLKVKTLDAPILPAWFQAAKELGYGVHDPNGNQTEGFTPLVMSMVNGVKQSSYKAFIKLLAGYFCVLINKSKKAYGVVYRRHGLIRIAHATKEVIVSGGWMSSPMLLMRSGIGPADVLQRAGIPVMSNLPGVGKNLRNHCRLSLPYSVSIPNHTLLLTINEDDMENEIIKYHQNPHAGFLTKYSFAQALFVSKRAKAAGQHHWPDIQIGISQAAPLNGSPITITNTVRINRPESSGTLGFDVDAYLSGKIKDEELAIIDYQAMSVPSDFDVLIEGIEKSLQIMENTTAFQRMGVQLAFTTPQNCSDLIPRSFDFWKCSVKQRGQIIFHDVGTNSMGPRTDSMSVVDSKLRVYGIKGLRVIDASVMPRTTNTQINPSVMLVAEKTSQEILTYYGFWKI